MAEWEHPELPCCGCEPPQMSKFFGRVLGAASERNSTEIDSSPRPAGAPPKSRKETERHEKEFQEMLAKFAKKEQAKIESDRRAEEQQIARKKQRDKLMAESTRKWCEQILPHWEQRWDAGSTRKLWALGLPPKVRGTVWELALGNQVGINTEIWRAIVEQISPVMEGDDSCSPVVSKLAGMILTDLPRTYPVLAFFHEGGPMQRPLREVLLAYAVYSPEIGYVQGMSYIVAMLLLNMDAYNAFKSLANMMHRHPHCLLFLRMDVGRMAPFYQLFDQCLMDALPELHRHFYAQGVGLDMVSVSYTHLRAHETVLDLVCRLLLEKKKKKK
eukprot:TRINITY_DN13511_c0_g1_i2.p1 TRINITY_DN13511_c0_g1~~TRINITY_DN13511_c0_g1_i2.p1  ORF type:complete len:329 (-),score=79.35 TRINITY_DN13511_c0_g1_i2:38-1024(-)